MEKEKNSTIPLDKKVSPISLPPLPKHKFCDSRALGTALYTVKQMRDYARRALLDDRKRHHAGGGD